MSEWISVKDRLPEEYELVVTYPYKTLAVIIGFEKDLTPIFLSKEEGGRLMKVTHWIPLPEKPND